MKLAALGIVLLFTGCASGVPDLDVAQVEKTCARWCEVKFPACAFDGAITTQATPALAACQKQYVSCVETCPPR